MVNKFKRILSGVLATIFIGQVMIYGDGASQGIAHAETISDIKQSIDVNKAREELAEEFDTTIEGIGGVEYFDYPEVSVMSAEVAEGPVYAEYLAVSGKVVKGTVAGHTANDRSLITVYIFDENWNELNSVTFTDREEYEVGADIGSIAHVKIECDGYLPLYLKDFGTGYYTVGTGESLDTVTLVPGDTTYNYDNENQWSDDTLNTSDADYVEDNLDATRGSSDFNYHLDLDGNGDISQDEFNYWEEYYNSFGDSENPITNMSEYDVNGDSIINDNDFNDIFDYYYGFINMPINISDFDGSGIFDLDDAYAYIDIIASDDAQIAIGDYNLDLNDDGLINAYDIQKRLLILQLNQLEWILILLEHTIQQVPKKVHLVLDGTSI